VPSINHRPLEADYTDAADGCRSFTAYIADYLIHHGVHFVYMQVWDSVLNMCRDVLRAVTSLDGVLEVRQARRLVDLTCAFALALETMVMRCNRTAQLRALLTPEEMETVMEDSNAPLTVTELLSQELVRVARENSKLSSSPQYTKLMGLVDQLGGSVTQCERLMKHPIPQVYTAHFLRLLGIWTFTLPFTLVGKLPSTLVPLVTGIIAWAFYGLNEIGVMVQYPFQAGIVDLKSLWKEIMFDARECFEGVRKAKEVPL